MRRRWRHWLSSQVEFMHQLSPQDAQFLYAETAHNLTHVTSVSIYDPSTVPGGGAVRYADIVAHVGERLAYNPLFFRRLLRLPLELDYPYWIEDEHFDLESHMQRARLPEPGDWGQFCMHMARYHSRPLDMRRPPWEILVLEGLDKVEGLARGCYAIAIKIHHAAVDGAALMRFLASLGDADNRGTPLVALQVPESRGAEMPGLPALLSRAVRNNLGSPLRIASTLARAAPSLARAARGALAGGRGKNPVPATRFNAALSPHKVFGARDVPLDHLKRIKTLHPAATVNDAVLAVCSGALRRYLLAHDELPGQSLIAWVPINARPRGADADDGLGNDITAMTTVLFTDEEDALTRLKRIQGATRASKAARSGVSARLMTDVTRHLPAATQALSSRLLLRSGAAARLCNLFISNVPGPQVPVYMNGALMVRSVGLAPLADGMGLFIATPSYAGQMSFNVISTRELLPDIEFFMQCLVESLAELLALTETRATASERRAGKRAAAAPKAAASASTAQTEAKTRTQAQTKTATKTKASTPSRAGSRAKAKAKAKAKGRQGPV